MKIERFGNAKAQNHILEATTNSFYFWKFWHLLSRFAFLRTILHTLPISCPFLSPFKLTFTAQANLGWKPVLILGIHKGAVRIVLL